MLSRARFPTCLAVLLGILAGPAPAQEQPNMVIVMDGSGSMWGQAGGRTKIELAREALSQVLSEATSDMQIGLLAYGHRVRGQCSDIEQLVPVGPADTTVPAILDAARRITPRGMTPLTDSVLQAAQSLQYSEQAATVILLTDGVETCEGDPCALGRMLAQQGIDFTAHVVGFDMTDAEQRTVACLAEETGGLFLAANDAEDLARALRQTIIANDPPPVPEPKNVMRQVNLIVRDTAGAAPVNGRQIDLFIEPLDEPGVQPDGLRVTMDNPVTAVGNFTPGQYMAMIRRDNGSNSAPLSVQLPFTVPAGPGALDIDLVLAARLRVLGYAHANLPMPDGSGNLPFAAYGSDAGRAHFIMHPVVNGRIDTSVEYKGINRLDVAVPPGEYFIRGGLARSFAREKLISVPADDVTEFIFDFEAARVFIDMRDAQGFPVQSLTSYFYDTPEKDWFSQGGGRSASGLDPFYLPVGTWRVDAGRSGGGASRAQAVFTVTRAGEDVTLTPREGDRVDDAGYARLLAEDNAGCITYLGGEFNCLVETVRPEALRALMAHDPDAGPQTVTTGSEFSGLWSSNHQQLNLHQDGRRVWGERRNGTLEGELSADGRILRGTWTDSSEWGTLEFVLDSTGTGFTGRWGRGSDGLLQGGVWSGTRDAATPNPLTRPVDVVQARDPNANNPAFDTFMTAVRDADQTIPAPAPAPAPDQRDQGADASDVFSPNTRYDYANRSGRVVVSLVFGPYQRSEEHGRSWAPGWVWLRHGWCAEGCDEQLLPVGGPAPGSVANAEERLYKGGIFGVTSPDFGPLAFAAESDGSLQIYALKGAYDDAVQLGTDYDQVRTGLGSYTPVSGVAADMAGWPPLPVDAATDLATKVTIGAIDLLPIGVFAEYETPPGQTIVDAFDRILRDPSMQPELAMQCARNPVVFYPDGLIAPRELDSFAAGQGNPPYTTENHEICEQSGPILSCTNYFGAPGQSNRSMQNGDDYTLSVAGGPQGTFALSDDESAYVYRPCYGAGGFLSAMQIAPDGVPMWQHVVRRDDGGPGLSIDADGTVSGAAARAPVPTSPEVNAAISFADIAGIWSRDGAYSLSLEEACYEAPAIVHDDGRIEVFSDGLDEDGLPILGQDYMQCSARSECKMLRDGEPAPRMGNVRFILSQPNPDNLTLCADGDCVTVTRCAPVEWSARERASGLADRWENRVMQRN